MKRTIKTAKLLNDAGKGREATARSRKLSATHANKANDTAPRAAAKKHVAKGVKGSQNGKRVILFPVAPSTIGDERIREAVITVSRRLSPS